LREYNYANGLTASLQCSNNNIFTIYDQVSPTLGPAHIPGAIDFIITMYLIIYFIPRSRGEDFQKIMYFHYISIRAPLKNNNNRTPDPGAMKFWNIRSHHYYAFPLFPKKGGGGYFYTFTLYSTEPALAPEPLTQGP
jgi:hypothetical protein